MLWEILVGNVDKKTKVFPFHQKIFKVLDKRASMEEALTGDVFLERESLPKSKKSQESKDFL